METARAAEIAKGISHRRGAKRVAAGARGRGRKEEEEKVADEEEGGGARRRRGESGRQAGEQASRRVLRSFSSQD